MQVQFEASPAVADAAYRQALVLATGGTIAGCRGTAPQESAGPPQVSLIPTGAGPGAAQSCGQPDGSYTAGVLPVAALGLEALAPPGLALRLEDVAHLDSKDMTARVWFALAVQVLAAESDAALAGTVITHGTDTLEETAVFLATVAPGLAKPVLLVGAMRPADHPQADGPDNLRAALRLVQAGRPAGVHAVLAGRVTPALGVRKLHPWALDAFGGTGSRAVEAWLEPQPQGRNAPQDAPPEAPVGAGDTGDLADPADVGGRLAVMQGWAHADAVLPRVEIVTSHAGQDGRLVRDLLALRARGVRLDGLVVAATGNGTVHAELEAALREAEAQGIAVRRATRITAAGLDAAALARSPEASALTPAQARAQLFAQLCLRGSSAFKAGE